MSREVAIPNLGNLIERYESGVSMKQLADETRITRSVLLRRFRGQGVHTRNRSEAETLKWATLKLDRGRVVRQCSAAWTGRRGMHPTHSTLVQSANTMEIRTSRNMGPWECEIADALRERGLAITQQRAFDTYNVDIALDELLVAVEVCRSNHTKGINPKKVEYIFNQGWGILVVFQAWPPKGLGPEFEAIADKIVAFANVLRAFPSGHRKYGVISRYGKPAATRCYEFDGGARIAGF